MSKRVFLVLPYLGQVEDSSRRAAYLYPTRRYSVLHRPSQASLLAFGLNMKWAEMENGSSEDGNVGGVYDYFAVLHADCSPDAWWLDTLIDEMDANDLGCIHAVVAVKNDEGLTSTALGTITDPRYPVRKLSLAEVHERLPRTFKTEDVIRCVGADGFEKNHMPRLLPNTGAFVLKVSQDGEYFPWVREFPGFTILDWMDRSRGDGQTRARVLSEDWRFGHWTQSRGIEVGGTRAVFVNHVGPANYGNGPPKQAKTKDDGFFRLVNEIKQREPEAVVEAA